MTEFKLNKYIIPYYVVLFLLMVLMSSPSSPSMAVRLLFLALVTVPLFRFNYMMPPMVICAFTLLSVTGTLLYLPLPYTDYYYYAAIILILFIQGKNNSLDGILPFILFWLYIALVDFATGSQIPGMKQYLPMLLLLGVACSGSWNNEESIPILMNTFCLISLLSSVLFFINYEEFLRSYNSLGLERSGWNDPNYFSCILGMGVVTAIIQLMRKESENRFVIIFWIATIVVSFISQVLLASRGGILAIAVAFLAAMLYVKIPVKYKLLIAILTTGFIVFLYNNGYFELLEFRINDDVGGGSNRINIWEKKLDALFLSSSPLNMLFGYGGEGGLKLGYGTITGAHNDLVAMITEYGLVGAIFFIYSFIWPYKKATGKYKSITMILLVYLAVVCFTLEPLTQGSFTYLSFYLMICVISKYSKIVEE